MFELAIKQDNERAMCELGIMYLGKGIKRDVNKAKELLEKSANKGYQKSILKIAKLYEFGEKDFPRDIDRAAHFYFLNKKFSEKENIFNNFNSLFFSILNNKSLCWIPDYHVFWPRPSDLNIKVILLLLISKHRKSFPSHRLLPVKGITLIIIQHLCHFCQKEAYVI